MKTIVLVITGIIISSVTFSQGPVYKYLDELKISPPVFQSGNNLYHGQVIASVHDYLIYFLKEDNIYYGNNFKGTEMISFQVTYEGNIVDIKIINSVGKSMDREILRLLKATDGKWIPGQVNNTSVTMEKNVSLVFIPYPGYDLVGEAKKLQAKGNEYLFDKKKPQKAIKYFNQACRLLPCQECVLSARSLCKYELGDLKGALEDCERILSLGEGRQKYGDIKPDELLNNLMTKY